MSRGRRIRLAALVAAAVALPLLALLVAAPMLVDRAALARRVEAEMTAAVGLPVRVDGITALGLLPTPHAELGPLRVLPRGAAGKGRASAPLVVAQTLRLELAWPALLLGYVEPVVLRAQGVELDWRPGTTAAARWLAALAVPAPRVRNATVTLDYPPGAKRLRWPLMGGASTGAPVGPLLEQRPGPLRIAASLPLRRVRPRLAGNLDLSARADLTELPVLTIAPLQLTGRDLDIGELHGLALTLSAAQARRNAEGRWRLRKLALRSGDLRIDGNLDLYQTEGDRLAGEGRLALAPLDLRAWLAQHREQSLPGQPQTLRCIAADGVFRLAEGLLIIAPAQLRADTTRAGAAATVSLGPLPGAAVVMRLDQLDLDPYLTPAAPAAAAVADAQPCGALADAAPAAPKPPAPPADDTELWLDLGADLLRVGALAYGNLAVVAAQTGSRAGADISAAAFYGGTLSARVEQTLHSGAPPRQVLRAEVRRADLGALLADLQGTPQVTGTADLTADLAATGADQALIRRDLSGTLRFDLRDGRLAALDQGAANFGPLLSAVGLPVTADAFAFSRLQAGAQGQHGVFTVADLDGRARLFRLGGGGRVDVGAETLDLALTATLVQPPDAADLKDLAGIEVPIRIKGDLAAPKVSANLAPALAEVARRSVRRHLGNDGNVLKQLEESTGVKGLEQGLRNLFGR
ncbi:MAG: AsmA-like C-terminal region-containing protein [Thiohalocapsa sp.]|uniref:AsmA family protein n=1 Tax=Thiohalocapsa sp. TaxID=2497641 RepID=UPI00260154D9|nr:AsmA-like C-terminal region-containing protein [Thiohalocapsa sp.]MCG6942962.1 AsmA-like C-terminal region-containing protein [Thiohalocapsa sp.]